jgi:hypothetical protein
MNLVEFGHRFRVKLVRELRETIIRGKHGQLYIFGPGKLGCLVMVESVRHWHALKASLMAAGCEPMQDGDNEGSVLVDPNDARQVNAAIKAIRAKRQRRLSTEQSLASVARLRHSLGTTQKNRGCS